MDLVEVVGDVLREHCKHFTGRRVDADGAGPALVLIVGQGEENHRVLLLEALKGMGAGLANGVDVMVVVDPSGEDAVEQTMEGIERMMAPHDGGWKRQLLAAPVGLDTLVGRSAGGNFDSTVRRTRSGIRVHIVPMAAAAISSSSPPPTVRIPAPGARESSVAAVVVASPRWLQQKEGFLLRIHGVLSQGGLLLAVNDVVPSAHPYVQQLLTNARSGDAGGSPNGEGGGGDGGCWGGSGSGCNHSAELGVAGTWTEPELLREIWRAGFDHGEVVLRPQYYGQQQFAALVIALRNPVTTAPLSRKESSLSSASASPQLSNKRPKPSPKQQGSGNDASSYFPTNPFQREIPRRRQPQKKPASGTVSECQRYFDPAPTYLTDGTFPALVSQRAGVAPVEKLLSKRRNFFTASLKQFKRYDGAARALSHLPPLSTTHLVTDQPVLDIGDRSTELDQPITRPEPGVAKEAEPGLPALLSSSSSSSSSAVAAEGGGGDGGGGEEKSEAVISSAPEWSTLNEVLEGLKPWKKGPLRIFGVDIDTEWRSDWKWDRIRPHLVGQDSLKGKAVADIGCANGYFMFRMLDEQPRIIVGIDPNLKVSFCAEFTVGLVR